MLTAQSQLRKAILRFSVFEVKPACRELTKNGRRIKIQKQPFEILCTLLERPGEVVSREELRARLWPDNTFVEYEDSLNTAVRKLRAALSDSSGSPRYIETVPLSGYRLIAAVTVVEAQGDSERPDGTTGSATQESSAPTVVPDRESPVPFDPQPAGLGQKPERRKLWLWAAGSGLLLVATIAAWLLSSQLQRTSDRSARIILAVLPFQNLTGDSNEEYFSDGLTEEMITQLGNLSPEHLGVIARTSVMHYKNTQTPLDQIGRELGVQYVIEGSVRRDENNVRITAQLIQMKDQSHLWARQYDRELKDLLTIQSEIASEVADEIQSTLGDRRPANPTPHAFSPEAYRAYDLYLRGQYFLSKRTVPALEQAIELFQQATAVNPNDARAFAGLAASQALLPAYSGGAAKGPIAKARAAALEALDLDEGLPEAHAALALIVQNYDWDWQTAEKEFRRAIELNANYATAHHWYAENLMCRGRFDEALLESEKARQLDPLSLVMAADDAAILYYSRQYDNALTKLKTLRDMDPNFPRAYLIMNLYTEKGMFGEAFSELEAHRGQFDERFYWGWAAYIYGRDGRSDQASSAIHHLLRMYQVHEFDPAILALAYTGTGGKKEAIAWLEKAYEEHSNRMTELKVNPLYDPLRGDPQFEDLLRHIGLAR